MIFKLKWKQLGAHIHVSVWAGTNLHALGRNGDLIFAEEEWAEFQNRLLHGLFTTDTRVIIEEVTGANAGRPS